MSYSIYYLLDPQTNIVRYVGCSKRPLQRYRGHMRDCYKVGNADWDSYKNCWIRSLLDKNLTPILQVVCIVQTYQEVQRIEIALIANLKSRGFPLTNSTAGGDGVNDPSEATRLKMRLAKLGKKQTPEHVEARRIGYSEAAFRRFEDREQRDKQAAIASSQWADPIARAKKLEGIRRYHAAKHDQRT